MSKTESNKFDIDKFIQEGVKRLESPAKKNRKDIFHPNDAIQTSSNKTGLESIKNKHIPHRWRY